MNNQINHLRDHLFEVIETLMDENQDTDKAKHMTIERAKVVNEVAQTIINSAKVEVDHINALGKLEKKGILISGSGFIPAEQKLIEKE